MNFALAPEGFAFEESMRTSRLEFDKSGYTLVRHAIASEAARLLGNAILIAEFDGALQRDDKVPGTSVIVRYPVCEALLLHLLPLMEAHTGKALCPTYSCARIYRENQALPRHKDRAACEISATMTLCAKSVGGFPIYLDSGGAQSFELNPGDMLIYRGCDIPHWREALRGEIWIQGFFHYVDKSGPNYPEHRYDKQVFREMCYKYILENL